MEHFRTHVAIAAKSVLLTVFSFAGLTCTTSPASAQDDPLQKLNSEVKAKTGNKLGFTFDERTRWEERDGVNFGKSVNQQGMFSRVRIGMWFQPLSWFKIGGTAQDARANFYGVPAPNTLRDTWDLQEGYLEFFGARKTGFGATFGRQEIEYGEGRVIGFPSWTNVARTYDTARAHYAIRRMRLEALIVSPVKVLPDQFNKPEPGERIWGAYSTFSGAWHGASFDAYALQHSQNKIAGWAGPGTLGTQSYGGRIYGSLPHKLVYGLEGIGQTGHIGFLTQRAYAWVSHVSRAVSVLNLPLNFYAEYKEASGSQLGQSGSSTYDQLSPSNHDKFGREDLFGWRNIRSAKSLETLNLGRSFTVNAMYTDNWLFSSSDSLYNSAGNSIAISKKGIAGTRVGQELDGYVTYKHGAHLFGAGVGHFFKGGFIVNTTPNINPRYFYIFQQYSFR